MTGAGELTAVRIDPKAVDPDDTETLGDLIVAAVRDASNQVQALAVGRDAPDPRPALLTAPACTKAPSRR